VAEAHWSLGQLFYGEPLNTTALDTYLLGIDRSAVPIVVALDNAVRLGNPEFDVAIK